MKKFLLSLAAATLCSAGAMAATATINFSEKFSANSTELTGIAIDDVVTVSFDKGTGSTAPQYYSNGTSVRMYAGNTMTVTGTQNITKVEFTFGASDGTNAITANTGTFESPVWTGDAASVVFSEAGSSGNRRIASLTVTYGEGGGNSGNENPGTGDEGQDKKFTFLTTGMNDFTVENTNPLPEGLTYVWSWDSNYSYAKASAYVSGKNNPTDCYLVSPEINLSKTNTTATFNQALNYLSGNNRADFVNVCVREGKDGQWATVNVSTWPAGSNWNFSDGCEIDLSAYAGKTIQIGFHYVSTSSVATTWEVKNLVVYGQSEGEITPGPEEPTGEKVTFDFSNPSALGIEVGEATEYDLTGVDVENGKVSIAFNSADGAGTPIRLYLSGGKWAMRFYKDTEFTVSVEKGYKLNAIEFNGTNLGTSWSYSNGELTDNTWTPSSPINKVTISKTATGNNPVINTMTVYFEESTEVPDEPGDQPGDDDDTLKGVFNFSDPATLTPAQEVPESGAATNIPGVVFTNNGVSFCVGETPEGKTDPRIWNSNGVIDFRMYTDEVFTVAVNGEQYHIAQIDFTKAGGNFDITPSAGTFTTNGNTATWTPAENQGTRAAEDAYCDVVFTATGSTRISTVTVTYEEGAGVTTGITNIEAMEGEAVYYNLNGQKVNNPEKGIFVKVQNGKAEKVIK